MIRRLALNIFAWTIVLAVAFPLFWMLVTSVKPQFELFRRPPTFLPEAWTFEHYWRLVSSTNFLIYFRNSVILSTSTTIVVIVIATIGAYSLVRFRYRGRESLAFLVLFTYLLPSVVLIISTLLDARATGLVEHHPLTCHRLHDICTALCALALAVLYGGYPGGS